MPFKIITLFFLILAGLSLHAAENLVKNPGFEEGLDAKGFPCGWIVEKTGRADGIVELSKDFVSEGKYCCHIKKTNDAAGGVVLMQKINLKKNRKYVFYLNAARTAKYRWHYYQIRFPGRKEVFNSHIADASEDANVKLKGTDPVIINTDNEHTLAYLTVSAWGNNNNDASSIGDIWVDEVVLKKFEARILELHKIGLYYFTTDTISGNLIFTDPDGMENRAIEIDVSIRNDSGVKVLEKVINGNCGNNQFRLDYSKLAPGKYTLTAVVKALKHENKDIGISKDFHVQEKY